MAAKKITKYVKVQIEAGKATPAPPLGPALGQAGVQIGPAFAVGCSEVAAREPVAIEEV